MKPLLKCGAWLDKTEQKRMLARMTVERIHETLCHTVTRDRAKWFPNAWWAIDGTKLDLFHSLTTKDGCRVENKRCFDVYSEKRT
jgi:hypothetical protein